MCSHPTVRASRRSEEHTSELQSPCNLVCRLLLEKKKMLTWNTNCAFIKPNKTLFITSFRVSASMTRHMSESNTLAGRTQAKVSVWHTEDLHACIGSSNRRRACRDIVRPRSGASSTQNPLQTKLHEMKSRLPAELHYLHLLQ